MVAWVQFMQFYSHSWFLRFLLFPFYVPKLFILPGDSGYPKQTRRTADTVERQRSRERVVFESVITRLLSDEIVATHEFGRCIDVVALPAASRGTRQTWKSVASNQLSWWEWRKPSSRTSWPRRSMILNNPAQITTDKCVRTGCHSTLG